MNFKRPVLAALLACMATSAMAEMVVINGRYIVPKDSIRGYFYRDRDRLTVFDIRWSDWSTQYRCQDRYDRTRITAASLNFTLALKEADSLDFAEFLDAEGFTDCKKF